MPGPEAFVPHGRGQLPWWVGSGSVVPQQSHGGVTSTCKYTGGSGKGEKERNGSPPRRLSRAGAESWGGGEDSVFIPQTSGGSSTCDTSWGWR